VAGQAEAGDAIVVPPGAEFELANAGAGPLRAREGQGGAAMTFLPP
jgi:mannose-6-phosphate isomerase-like protein (cupin superfamily)